ncbi:MAG TPA: VC0807 family protein [Verrucomicrobiaceae bacterium]
MANSTPPPNALADLVLTVVLPSIVLEQLSDPARLGPAGALVVSLLFPVGFAVWCWWKHAGWNVFSIIGFITVLLSGGLGLLKLNVFWFAVKESAMTLALGMAFPISHLMGKPLINALLLQPHMINVSAMRTALSAPEKHDAFQDALRRGSWGIGFATILSSVGNFLLVLYLLRGKEPGSEAFVKGIGVLNWASVLVIGVPLCAVMLMVFVWLVRKIQSITGLDRADLMNPGRTVRRQVGR